MASLPWALDDLVLALILPVGSLVLIFPATFYNIHSALTPQQCCHPVDRPVLDGRYYYYKYLYSANHLCRVLHIVQSLSSRRLQSKAPPPHAYIYWGQFRQETVNLPAWIMGGKLKQAIDDAILFHATCSQG